MIPVGNNSLNIKNVVANLGFDAQILIYDLKGALRKETSL